LKRPNNSKVRLRLMHESPKASFNISKLSLPVLRNFTQNLMQTLCSLTSALPPISENHRRLMQYIHKDTCNNQTFPHPTTSLGTLTQKKPPQYTRWRDTRELQATFVLWALSWDFWIHVRMYAIYRNITTVPLILVLYLKAWYLQNILSFPAL